MADEGRHDPVRRPGHYEGDGEVDCMRAMRSMMHGTYESPMANFWWGSAMKYLWRWAHKGRMQDLSKAARCIEYLVEEVGGAEDGEAGDR